MERRAGSLGLILLSVITALAVTGCMSMEATTTPENHMTATFDLNHEVVFGRISRGMSQCGRQTIIANWFPDTKSGRIHALPLHGTFTGVELMGNVYDIRAIGAQQTQVDFYPARNLPNASESRRAWEFSQMQDWIKHSASCEHK